MSVALAPDPMLAPPMPAAHPSPPAPIVPTGLSRPDSRSDPIGGSEPVSGTGDSGLGLFFFFFYRTDTYGYGPHLITESKYHIHLQSPIYIYKTELLLLQIRARNLHVVNPYKCVGPAVCGCLLMSSPVPTRIKNPC